MPFSLDSVLERVKIFGNPFRGLARAGSIELDGADPAGSITEPISQPVKGATELLQPSPPPAATIRTPEEALDDTSKGYKWENFSLLSGENKTVYGKEIGQMNSIYMDPGGRNWLFNWDMPSVAYPAGGSTFNATGTLVREFGCVSFDPLDQPPPADVNVVKMDEDYARNTTEEDTYISAANPQMNMAAHAAFPVQQSPDGSKVLLIWRTGENPPDIQWGSSVPAGFGSHNNVISYIVEVTISGTATDGMGTGIFATGTVIKSFEISFLGDRELSGPWGSFAIQMDAGADGTSTLNTMKLHRIRSTSDMVTCLNCETVCPSGSATHTGSHSQTFSNIPATGQNGGLRYWNGEHIYEKKMRAFVSAYYDSSGTAHFIEVENRVWQRQEYSFDFTQTINESISHTRSAPCPAGFPISLSGTYTYSMATTAQCIRETSWNQSIEVFIDGGSEDFHSIENIQRETQVVAYTEADSAGPGDIDFDVFSQGCLTGPGSPCAATDNWYLFMGGSNFSRSGTKTTTNEVELKKDGAILCEDEDVLVTPIDEVSPVGTLIPCFTPFDKCDITFPSCVGGTPTASFGCEEFPESVKGCTPDVGSSAPDSCHNPDQPCEGVLPRGIIVAPLSRDLRAGWYMHSNRSLGYFYNLRYTACDVTPGNYTNRHLRAVADGHLDTRETVGKEIRSTVHPVDDRFEVSEDDNIAWV